MSQTTTIAIHPQHLQWMGEMLTASPDKWEREYWKMRLNEVLASQEGTYPTFSFDYGQRCQFYRFINAKELKNAPIDYLEFGVAAGTSMRNWLSINRNEESTFHGFDSFEGLPEDWNDNAAKGAYTTHGRIPQVDDDRCTFLAGWFQDTMPGFVETFSPQNRLVMHMDADLYSSTLYSLTMFDKFIVPGTVILFDEFTSKDGSHEFAALYDYSRSYYKKWRIIASREDHVKLAVIILP